MEWLKSSYQCKLPVDGSGDGVFSGMGIEFGPFEENDKWRGANLPEGLVLDKSKVNWVILDSNRSVRATVYPKNHIHIRPNCRFRFGHDPYATTDDSIRFCIWDKKIPFPEPEKVAMERVYTMPSKKSHPDVYNNRFELYKKEFEELASRWLSERYPKWQDYDEYWQD